MGHRYDILVVEDDEMPAGKDWMMVKHRDGVLAVVTQSAVTRPEVLAEAWAADRHYVRLLARGLRATG